MSNTPEPNEHGPDDNETPANDTPQPAPRARRAWEDEEDEDTVESLREERDEALQTIATMGDSVRRAQADLVQQIQRNEEQKKTIERIENKAKEDKPYAISGFVKDVLPVIDTLELGLRAISKTDRAADPKFDKLATGIEKTLQQLTAVFNKHGIQEINPINAAFDENKHEVISTVPVADTEPETVVDVAQKGYEINGRLIRPAKVIITPMD